VAEVRGARAVEAVEIVEPALADRGDLDAALADALEGEFLALAYVSAGARRLIHDRLDLDLEGRPEELAVLVLAARAFDAAATAASAVAAADFAARAMAAGRPPDDPVAGGYWCLMAGVASMWSDRFDLSERLMDSMVAEARRVGGRAAGGERDALAAALPAGALPTPGPTPASR
jgi:hypothetical protein